MKRFLVRTRLIALAGCLIVAVGALANCQKRGIAPVALAPEDMCSYCRMAISEKQYAAEVIDSDGQAFKFDDIGCMVDFVESKKNKAPIVAYFVMDFDKREWIKGEDAYYVRAPEVNTPMNGGIIAFRTQSQAQQAVDKYQGKLLRWKDIVR
jgi:copper chaperone NosL